MGKLIIFSAPSGAGKTTIVRHLIEKFPELEFSISACSRPKRNGEVHGKDYYFLSPETFRQKIDSGAFLEWEEVYDNNFYGTLSSEIDRIWANGKHAIFDVDVVGGLNIKKAFGDKALAIFVMPPSVEELARRLDARDTETAKSLARRIGKAQEEMEYSKKFDTILINDNLEIAKVEAEKLLTEFLTTS